MLIFSQNFKSIEVACSCFFCLFVVVVVVVVVVIFIFTLGGGGGNKVFIIAMRGLLSFLLFLLLF